MRKLIRARGRQFVLYLISGGLTLAIYTLILVGLIEVVGVYDGVAAGLAMLLGGTANYLLVRTLVFRSDRRHVEAAPRFVVVLLANAGANAAVTALACDIAGLPYGPVQIVYLAVATVTIYVVMGRWVIGRGADRPANG